MQTIIDLGAGRVAQLTYYVYPDFMQSVTDYDLLLKKKNMYNGNGGYTAEDEKKLNDLRQITGYMICLPNSIRITDFNPVATQFIPTAHIITWDELKLINKRIDELNHEYKMEGLVKLWDPETGLYNTDY